MSGNSWIGVDLDGTFAHYEGWKGVDHIGDPIPAMLERVKKWLEAGQKIKIFTARVYCGESGEPEGDRFRDAQIARTFIEKWCLKHLGTVLPVTCCKDFGMVALYDDRCYRVELNTGRVLKDK